MKVRVWVDENGLARCFDRSDFSVRVCTPEEAAQLQVSRSRTTTREIAESTLTGLVERTRSA